MELLKCLAESSKEIKSLGVLFRDTDRTQMFLSFVENIKVYSIKITDRFPKDNLEYSITLNDFTKDFSIKEYDPIFFEASYPLVTKFEVSGNNLKYLNFEGCQNFEIKRIFYDHEEKEISYQLDLDKVMGYQKKIGN